MRMIHQDIVSICFIICHWEIFINVTRLIQKRRHGHATKIYIMYVMSLLVKRLKLRLLLFRLQKN